MPELPILKQILHGFIPYRIIFFHLTGQVDEALFLSYCWHWTTTNPKTDGWFYHTQIQMELATGIKRRSQLSIRRKLKSLGYIQERYGARNKLWFRTDTFVVCKAIEDWIQTNPKRAIRLFEKNPLPDFGNVADINDKRPKMWRKRVRTERT